MNEQNVSGIPIVEGRKLRGILTKRDLKFLKDYDAKISSVMVKNNLVTAPPNTTLEQAKGILQEHKVEKLLLVNDDGELTGLITMRDIDRVERYPLAARDQTRPAESRSRSRRPRLRANRGPDSRRGRCNRRRYRSRPFAKRHRHRKIN